MVTNTENTDKGRKPRRRSNSTEIKWAERVVQINRVTKVVKGGKKLSFRAIVVIGNENGQVGVGVGKAEDVIGAVKKAVTDAKKHVIVIPLTKNKTIPHLVNGVYGASKVVIRPAGPGSGVIAGSSIRTVLELAGVQNILAKQLGSGNLLNNARAVICALESLRTISEAAEQRDIQLEKFYV